jgi:hypothetical protein
MSFTPHEDRGPLHGITVLVETKNARTIVGRCHEATDQHVILLDADEHDGNGDRSEWIDRAVRWGVFPKHKSMNLPADEVTSIRPLGELATGG